MKRALQFLVHLPLGLRLPLLLGFPEWTRFLLMGWNLPLILCDRRSCWVGLL